jgi:hypothetical protein
MQVFLDERGGDYDDCTTFQQLVRHCSETCAATSVVTSDSRPAAPHGGLALLPDDSPEQELIQIVSTA